MKMRKNSVLIAALAMCTTLNPKDFATRAEIAAILQRFIENNK